MPRVQLLALMVLLMTANLSAEEEKKKPLVPSAAARALLAKQKVVITEWVYASVASPYKARDLPYFITSDSVVGAYHLLLRETVARLEWGKIVALPAALAALEENLAGAIEEIELDLALEAAAEKRARIVLRTARLLLGAGPPGDDTEVHTTARAEADRIEAATASEKPAWYGAPDPDFRSIDYARFKPTALDASVPEVARGHRVIRWLTFLPLRVSRNEEFLAWVMLARAAAKTPQAAEAFGGYPELLGPGDEITLADARLAVPRRITKKTFDALRRKVIEIAPASPVRDRRMDLDRAPEATVRILPSVTTDCARLLQAISDRRLVEKRDVLPSSLAVGAALGSNIARDALPKGEREELGAFRRFASGQPLFDQYLRCLSHLNDPPEEGAPAFMASRAWRLKSLQTTMAGWTGARHAWKLRVKETMAFFGMAEQPGFVEPVPKFFSGVADVAEETEKRIEKLGASKHSMARVAAVRAYEALADILEELGWESYRGEDKKPFWGKFWDAVLERPVLVTRSGGLSWSASDFLEQGTRNRPETAEAYAAAIERIRECAQQLRLSGRARMSWWRKEWVPAEKPLEPRWELLAKTAKRLTVLARRQLKNNPVTEDDGKWIRAYGRTLSTIIDEPPTGVPTDDAFAAVSVFTDPATGRRLISAIGRPRALYVLWPSDGKEILCRGAALPWHEFVTDGPITDADWRERLDGEPPPRPHELLRELYVE